MVSEEDADMEFQEVRTQLGIHNKRIDYNVERLDKIIHCFSTNKSLESARECVKRI